MDKVKTLISENKLNDVQDLFKSGSITVSDVDEDGMTPLMHAALHGHSDICKSLIDLGSDVNAVRRNLLFTPLHYAAVSGNLDVVDVLLAHNADTAKTNSVDCTAADVANFLGLSSLSSTINGHIKKSMLSDYVNGKSPCQIDEQTLSDLYDFIMQNNLSPVHLTIKVGRTESLLRNLSSVAAVLDDLANKDGVNEVLSMKFHYLSYLSKHLASEAEKFKKEASTDTKTPEPEAVPMFEMCLKQFLKSRSSDGAEVFQELWIRDAIQAFPNSSASLHQQLIHNTSGTECQALHLLTKAITGRGLKTTGVCYTCANPVSSRKSCAKCKVAQYCGRYCQKLHWFSHKKMCEKMLQNSQKKAMNDVTEKAKNLNIR